MSYLDVIKEAIRTELKADGCTQKDLADYLGLSQKHVSQILTGKVQGSHDVIESMARALGLSLSTGKGDLR